MTPDEARAFCDDLQERVTQMGERTGEGFHLGRCLSVIRGLASQIDDQALQLAAAAKPKRAKAAPVVEADDVSAAVPDPPPAPRLDE